MAEERAALRRELPRMLHRLATSDINETGTYDQPEIRRFSWMRVGVVTTDMGLLGAPAHPDLSCAAPFGDDGILLETHRGDDPSCEEVLGAPIGAPSVEFETSGADTSEASANVACLVDTGGDGCNIPQPLEAALKAITPSTFDVQFPVFSEGSLVSTSSGHGDQANIGFVSHQSVLAIIVLTDQDDCSSPERDLYDLVSSDAPYPPLSVATPDGGIETAVSRQCAVYREAQYAIERYVESLLTLRDDRWPTVFATIAGIDPVSLEAHRSPETRRDLRVYQYDYDALLAAASMQERPDATGLDLEPSCVRATSRASDLAFPPRRLLETTRGVDEAGGVGVLGSICRSVDPSTGDDRVDLQPALDAVVNAIVANTPLTCAPYPLERDALGAVPCAVFETEPEGTSCAQLANLGRVGFDPPRYGGDGREVCRVLQRTPSAQELTESRPPNELGWFYDDYTTETLEVCPAHTPHRIRFSPGAQPSGGARYRIECLTGAGSPRGAPDVGTRCEEDPGVCTLTGDALESLRSRYDRDDATLFCDSFTATCQLACEENRDCPGGQICYGTEGGNQGSEAFCLSPTCQLSTQL